MGRARESLKLHIVLPPKLAEALIAHCGAIGDRPGAVALDPQRTPEPTHLGASRQAAAGTADPRGTPPPLTTPGA